MYRKGDIVYVRLNGTRPPTIFRREYSDWLLRNYLGGRGFCTYVLSLFSGKIPKSAVHRDNLIVISSGILSGTSWPSSGRTTISVLKSPVTGFFGDGNFGGHFGPALRLRGIDCLILDGASATPCYFLINREGGIELYDASTFWEASVGPTDAMIRHLHGAGCKVLAIGQAGSNKCFSAIPLCDNRAAGGGGSGAVLGSKNIKAIAVWYDPTEKLGVENQSMFDATVTKTIDRIKRHPVYNTFKKYGTTSLIEIHSGLDYLPTKNWVQSNMEEWKKVCADSFYKLFQKQEGQDLEGIWENLAEHHKLGCRNCPIVCSNPSKIEYETINCLGPKLGVSDPDWIDMMNMIYFNDAGADVIQTTSVVSALMQMYEDKVSSYPIKWGDKREIQKFLSDFVGGKLHLAETPAVYFRNGFRRGLVKSEHAGRIKFDWSRFLDLYGYLDRDPFVSFEEHYYVNVKGMGLSGVYPNQKNKGVALAVATSSRGADHLRSLPTLATYASWYLGTSKGIVSKLKNFLRIPFSALRIMKADRSFLVGDLYKTYNEVFGVPKDICDQWEAIGFLTDEKKVHGWGSMIKFTQSMYAVSDAAAMCRFTSPWRFGVGPEILCEAIKYETGIDLTWRELLRVGERIFALEKELLYHYGKEVRDTISDRFFLGKGALDHDLFLDMLYDYYQACGFSYDGRPKMHVLNNLVNGSSKPEDKELYDEIIRARSYQDSECSES
jgi:aldehyde:ferredoxin oxidoreductase